MQNGKLHFSRLWRRFHALSDAWGVKKLKVNVTACFSELFIEQSTDPETNLYWKYDTQWQLLQLMYLNHETYDSYFLYFYFYCTGVWSCNTQHGLMEDQWSKVSFHFE